MVLEDKGAGGVREREKNYSRRGVGKRSTQLYPRWMEHDGPFIYPVTGSLQERAVFCAVISALLKRRHHACLPEQPLLGFP